MTIAQDELSGRGLRVEHRPVAALIPYARNARTHSEAQIALIAGSIREFGFANPVLVDGSNGIIAGHGRVLAARKLGLAAVPVIVLAHLTDAQKRALALADNRLALDAGWNDDMLRIELHDLQADGFDLTLTGFDMIELARLLDEPSPGLTDPDDIPDAPAQPTSATGDVWLLGPHRLVCGDCTDGLAVAHALNGVAPNLMVTDPPYGVNYDPAWRNKVGAAKTQRTGKVENDDRADWREAWALFPGDVAYIWHGALNAAVVAESLEAAGFAIRSQIIWAKERLVLSRGDYHWQHEPCWYAVRKGGRGNWAGDRKQTTLWQIASRDQDAKTVHGTQKPVEAMRRPIENNSSPGQAVYEPFSGSGTTIIAAEMAGRACHAIELAPAYVDRRMVEQHAAVGTRHEQIAKILGVALNTMKKFYREELDLGLARANAVVASTLFAQAKGGNITAMIFWLKTRGGWRETARLEHSGAPGEPIEIRQLDATRLSDGALAELLAARKDAP